MKVQVGSNSLPDGPETGSLSHKGEGLDIE